MSIIRSGLAGVGLTLAMACGAAAQPANIPGEPVPSTFAIGVKPGHPLDNLPAGTRMISPFGERPVFSPDGRRIAFLDHAMGDAYEYDLSTGKVRNLTGHAPHAGIFRVHYLRDGSFVLSAAAQPGLTPQQARGRTELYWMDAAGSGLLIPLGQKLFEGVAVSRSSNRIAWATMTPDGKSPREPGAEGASTLWVGEVEHKAGAARLSNIRKLTSKAWSDCVMEGQDFLPDDAEVLVPCYRFKTEGAGGGFGLSVLSVKLTDGRVTDYPVPKHLYNEVEGVFPDGKRALVECGNDNRIGLDLCLLELTPTSPRYTRLTFAQDYGNYRFANPMVSPDGRRIVFHYGLASDEAGMGRGILLMDLPAGF